MTENQKLNEELLNTISGGRLVRGWERAIDILVKNFQQENPGGELEDFVEYVKKGSWILVQHGPAVFPQKDLKKISDYAAKIW